MQQVSQQCVVPEAMAGERLDRALAQMFNDYSRSRLQKWLRAGHITVDGQTPDAKYRVSGGEAISLTVVLETETDDKPEPMALDVVHEDDKLLVINKPAGLVVHPAAGNWAGTLLNGLLHHAPQLHELPRGGIVHRLDKDTTGLMVIAKTLPAHTDLVAQLQARTVSRSYQAVVKGHVIAGATVDTAYGRHPTQRTRMAVLSHGERHAVTHYRVGEQFGDFTLLDVQLETGRTHQIRVHLQHAGYPIVGDPVYGGKPKFPKGASEAFRTALQQFRRQALHARKLSLRHPDSGEEVAWEAPMADDMRALIGHMREHHARR